MHGAVLPPLHLLPIPGAEDRHPEGPDERTALGARAHHRGTQEPGQKREDASHSAIFLPPIGITLPIVGRPPGCWPTYCLIEILLSISSKKC